MSAPFLEELYVQFKRNPEAVEPSWRAFFEGMEWASVRGDKLPSKEMRIFHLIESYRRFGHLAAWISPFTESPPPLPPQLELKTLGFEEKELKLLFPTRGLLVAKEAPLEEIIQALRSIYCGSMGVEYKDLIHPGLEKWLEERLERPMPPYPVSKKREILDQLNKAELFELFLHTKYVGQKRFSLEGGETLIPLLHALVEKGATLGMQECVLGMSHRGRLNVLVNILNKSFSMVFGEFEDYYDPTLVQGTDDVKYHKGYSSDVITSGGHKIHISLTPNPSHLESVDPVVEGKVYAKQIHFGDTSKSRVLPILIHGDASLAGQGVVYECLQLYRLAGYGTGGTLHIALNNHIGFTTLPQDARSTTYCTDIARTFSAPVFHVNAEEPETCIFAMELAVELRQTFHCDVFIDLNCVRKYGHNEGDEPAFTQPLQYQFIRRKPSIRQQYRDRLVQGASVEKEVAGQLEEEFKAKLHHELTQLKLKKEAPRQEAFSGVWGAFRAPSEQELFQPCNTAVSLEVLQRVAASFTRVPEDFALHPKIVKLQEERLKMAHEGSIDWGMGEHLAFATLLAAGTPIRLAGQDSRRGTFSQRHAVWIDQKTSAPYYPLQQLGRDQGRFEVIDAPLSEYAALGFEFGYSLSAPQTLALWEAQFGDFANCAQVVIDQYIATSAQKWARHSGLVLLLPHGFEGQGPEHSSARVERFLQLAGHLNMQIVNPTTPAQLFHLLRRQMARPFRLPLIIFTPKGLLRHPLCISGLEEFTQGGFQEVLEERAPLEGARRLILCSGRVYYDLLAAAPKERDGALVRIEQLYPLHSERLKAVMSRYRRCEELIWVQEEPKNMGAWSFLAPHLMELAPGRALRYVGRGASASPAAGSHGVHEHELQTIIREVWGERS